MWYTGPLVLLTTAVTDVFWTLFTANVAAKRPIRSGLASTAIVLCGSYAVMEYTHNPIMVLWAAAGAFIGSATTVWLAARRPTLADTISLADEKIVNDLIRSRRGE